MRDILLAQQPNKRFATVEEIGDLTAFLCGLHAAAITGAAPAADGGWIAHSTETNSCPPPSPPMRRPEEPPMSL